MLTTGTRTGPTGRHRALAATALGVAVAALAVLAAVSRLRAVSDLVEESEDYEAENAAMLVVEVDPDDPAAERKPEDLDISSAPPSP
ncbi:hypothetical protein ACNHYB_03070 [Isoptericola jiangsuensis]|uniref:hypothetical protein n=1 Tax=Isoptericola jiangsuensis TaxID=548579 RepID=UPI003AAF6F9B